MARTDLIVSVDARDVTIIEKDGSEILFNETTRVSSVGYSVRGNTDLTNADCQLSFILNGKNTGFAKFSELTSVLLTGVENLSNYANWREAMDDLEGYFFAQTVTVGNLSGLATAANQSELLLRLGAVDGSPAAHTLIANLLSLKKDYAGQFIDSASGTELLFGFFTRSNTTGAVTGMTFIKQSDLTAFVPASGVTSYETEMLSYLSQSRDLLTDIKTAVEALAATIDTGRILVTDQH